MRAQLVLLAVVIAAAACTNPKADLPPPEVFFLTTDGTEMPDGETIPYHANGQFAVGVRLEVGNMQQTTRAAVEIAEPASPVGAVQTGTATLARQPDGTFSGSVGLTWPPGGPVHVRVHALGQSVDAVAHVAAPQLRLDLGSLHIAGFQRVIPLCIESTTLDGTVAIHLEGATFQASGQGDATATLVRGQCLGIPPSDPELVSHALLTAVASRSFDITAALANTTALLQDSVTVAPVVPSLTLVSASGNAPAPGSIVELDITAGLDGNPATNATVQLQAAPDVTVVPSPATTDSQGTATAFLLMPSDGSPVHVEASFGSIRASVDLQ